METSIQVLVWSLAYTESLQGLYQSLPDVIDFCFEKLCIYLTTVYQGTGESCLRVIRALSAGFFAVLFAENVRLIFHPENTGVMF